MLSAPADTVGDACLRFIGNATLLLEANGIRLLTDPNFLHAGDHAHIGYGMTTKRLKDPAIAFEALPPLDAVLLSHYHGDHFDRDVEAKLARSLPIVTTPHAARILRAKKFHSVEALETWEPIDLCRDEKRVTITAMPGEHGPGVLRKLLPQVMGSLVSWTSPGRPPLRIYISGDTLIHQALYEIPKRFQEIDVAVLHLGGTKVFGVLVSLDGKGGVEALRILQPRQAIPVHYEEYTVMKSPLSDFISEARAAGFGDRIRYVERGESVDLHDAVRSATGP